MQVDVTAFALSTVTVCDRVSGPTDDCVLVFLNIFKLL